MPALSGALLAGVLVTGLLLGRVLGAFFRLSRCERACHRLVQRMGEKMNRPERPIETRATRGFVVPVLLMVGAALVGHGITLLGKLSGQQALIGGGSISVSQILMLLLLAALLSPARFLWPLWKATRASGNHAWPALDAPLTALAGGSASTPDGHGNCRFILQLSLLHFVHHLVGSALALLVASLPGLLVYRVLQLCALHYDGRAKNWRGFHWASEKLAMLVALPASIIALLCLTVAGQLLPGVRPLYGFWQGCRGKEGVFFDRFLAFSLGLTLGGTQQR
jgi:cobalamin biosynthesis protein CobD/CbiB